MNAHAVARERNRDLWDLYDMAACAACDLKLAAAEFERASRYSDASAANHALVTLRAVARVLTEAVADYERSISPIPALMEAADGR